MPKAQCSYEKRSGDRIMCRLTNELCGHVKYCRSERRWKISDYAVNCTVPKKYKEAQNGR